MAFLTKEIFTDKNNFFNSGEAQREALFKKTAVARKPFSRSKLFFNSKLGRKLRATYPRGGKAFKRLQNCYELDVIYWVAGGECGDFCEDCIDDAVEQAKKDDPDNAENIFEDGGYDLGHETDYPTSCESCGVPLASVVLEVKDPENSLVDTFGKWRIL